jgi:NUMOD4 motif/HNH endonuclease
VGERWRKVPGWPYEASSLGSVRRQGNEVPLTATADKDGYLRVTLTDGRRRKTFRVNVLVALAWHGPPEVLHGNGLRQDNRPENLRYGSRRENVRESGRWGLIQSVRTGSVRRNGEERRGKGKYGRDVSRPPKAVTGVTEDARSA